jgi:hypothetical protein
MSSVPRQLGVFAAVLAVLFGVGALAGHLIGPGGHDSAADAGHGAPAAEAGHGGGHAASGEAPAPVRGLGVAQDGLRLSVDTAELPRGRSAELRFRILDEHGEPVHDYDVEHTKRMHLILARRDMAGFQHLHPALSADGTWSVRASIAEPGSYRLFADFARDGKPITLAGDVRVDGVAALQELPARETTAKSDGGYVVEFAGGHPSAGEEADLRFAITRDGRPIRTEPYLGAGGHLVALREGDMGFLHVHPTDEDGQGIGFGATFPTAGRYRLFLQFQHAGAVQTVAFTEEVS